MQCRTYHTFSNRRGRLNYVFTVWVSPFCYVQWMGKHIHTFQCICVCMTFLLFACICFCMQVPCSWGNPFHVGWGNGTRHCWPTGNFGLLDTTRLGKFPGDLTRPRSTRWFMRESFNFQVCENFLITQTISILSTPPKYQDEITCYFRGFLTCWDSFKVSNLCLEMFWYIFSCQSPGLTFDFRPDRGSKWVGFGATLYGQGSRSWPEQQKLLFGMWWVRTQPQIILWQF